MADLGETRRPHGASSRYLDQTSNHIFLHSSASKELTDFLLCSNLILGAIVPKRVGEPIKEIEKDEGWIEMKKRRGFQGDCHGFFKLEFEILMESKGICRERVFALEFEIEIQDFGWI